MRTQHSEYDRRIDRDHFEASPSTGPRETTTIMAAAFGLGDRTLDEGDEDTPTEPAADHGPRPTPAGDAEPTTTEGRP